MISDFATVSSLYLIFWLKCAVLFRFEKDVFFLINYGISCCGLYLIDNNEMDSLLPFG